MGDLKGKVECPVCGEEVDLDDTEKAVAHMSKDEAHKNHLDKARINHLMEMFTRSGIIRKI